MRGKLLGIAGVGFVGFGDCRWVFVSRLLLVLAGFRVCGVCGALGGGSSAWRVGFPIQPGGGALQVILSGLRA